MRIAVIGTRGFPDVQGGIETHCRKLYPLIAADGIDVTVFGRAHYLGTDKTFYYEGVKVVPLPSSHRSAWEAITHTIVCIPQVWRLHPDIVHIHGIGPSLFCPIFKLMGLKVIYTHHGQDYKRGKWGRLAKLSLKIGERVGTLFADRVIVISKYIKLQLKEKYNCNKSVLIRNGVTLPQKHLENEGQFLAKHGLEPQKYILAVGRFVQEKNFVDLIDAYKIASPQGIKLCIAGDADHESHYSIQLKEQAKNAGCVLPGVISGDELNALYSNARLFVISSSHEGLPIVLLEAMSFGLEVLASDIPANLEVPLPQDCYYPLGNSDILAKKIKSYLAQEKSHDFTPLIRNFYDWKKIANQTVELYQELVKGKNE